MEKCTIKNIDIGGKRVLMRVDFNVPLDDHLNITDDTRIKAAIPTIKYAVDHKAKVILMSHLGRPKGKAVDTLRLDPVAKRLGELLNKNIVKLNDCIGQEVKNRISQMREGDIVLLENLRFHTEEEADEENFARQLASLGEVFVNDAFGAAHRAHASTHGVTKFLPSVAGFLLEKEIEYLDRALRNPLKPFAAILGGAKVSDKIGMLENLLTKVDLILIGGGMAYTFLKAQGKKIGNSKLEEDKINLASRILKKAQDLRVKVGLPIDHLIAERIDQDAETKRTNQDIPEGWVGVDIGPRTIDEFRSLLTGTKTVVWNGPLGVFEIDTFSKGTREIAQYVASLDAVTIIGGGDTAAAIKKFGLEEKMTHISTGGGASLEFLEGKTLPGIAALKDKE